MPVVTRSEEGLGVWGRRGSAAGIESPRQCGTGCARTKRSAFYCRASQKPIVKIFHVEEVRDEAGHDGRCTVAMRTFAAARRTSTAPAQSTRREPRDMGRLVPRAERALR